MANSEGRQNSLKHGAIGTIPLVFLVIAAAAPLAACAANIPLIVGLGNGIAAPMDFVFIGVLLILFSVGYTAMSSHVTNAGAFYTYISMGLGRRLGGAAGYVAVVAYNLLSVYTACVGGYFANDIFSLELGIEIPWWAFTIVLYVVVYLLGYFGIEGGTKFLMVCLACEVTLLAVLDVSVLVQAGPASFTLQSFSPEVFFSAAPGLGIAFAFLCFIGFEATAIFGEETKDPRRTVPRATYVAVIFVGLVYAFSAWAVVAGNGSEQIVAMAQGEESGQIFYNTVNTYLGPVFGHIYNWLLVVSSFACWLAVHNMASRYLFAFGRAGLLPRALGRTHAKHQSPYVAGLVQMAFALIIVVVSAIVGLDPYAQVGATCSAVAVVGVMVLELLVSLSVIRYLHQHNQEQGFGYNVFQRVIAPLLALIGMGYIASLVISNFAMLTGLESVVLNTLFACLMIIVGIIGFFVCLGMDKKGKLVDPASIDVN